MDRLSRALPLIAWPLLAAGLMFGLAVLGIELTRQGGRIATVWLANGAIIALLLRQPRDRWPALLVASTAGNVAAGLAVGDTLFLATGLALCNLAEIAVVARFMAPKLSRDGFFGSLAQLGWLGLLALLGPLLSMLGVGLVIALAGTIPDADPLLHWLIADTLGIMIVAPLVLAFTNKGLPHVSGRSFEFMLLLVLAAAVTARVFSYPAASMFLVMPVLVVAGMRFRLERAALVVALVCAIGGGLTLAGYGPLGIDTLAPGLRNYLIQAFIATAIMLTLPISALSLEREQAVSALRLREEQYRLLADHGSDIVVRLDGSGHAWFVSSAAQRLLGLTPDELRGAALIERIIEEDRAHVLAALAGAQRFGEATTCFRMRHARGDPRWIEANFRLARKQIGAAPDELEIDLVGTFRDIHQRRTAELLAADSAARQRETNRLLLMAEELASLGHWTYDAETETVSLSSEAAALLHRTQRRIAAADVLRLVAREDRRDLLRSLVRARLSDAPAECVVHVDVGAVDPRTVQLRIHRTAADDRPHALFGVMSDITDKLAAEQQLVAALDEARSAATFRSLFLATMSHEIRTPMTGVIGMIDLLAGEPDEDERRLYIDTLRQSADLLMAVLNDILDFSKVDAGLLTFAEQPFDLGRTLQSTLRLFDRAASSRGLALRLDAPTPGTLWLRGDALRLQQVLSNLLSNAIKFSEAGEVALRCHVQRRAGGRQALRISVEDQGVGIPRAVQARLFEPFVQGEPGGSRGGTGLGLSISRRLAEGMGGALTLQSSEGSGSTFTLDLTLPQTAGPAPAPAPAAPAPGGKRPLDLLLAEDNPVNQLLVTALLKRMGHQVTCVADGEAAVAMAATRRFDLILMDMQMPRCDGIEAAGRIRQGSGVNCATPIVALTADAAAERRPLYDVAGIDTLLTKPIASIALGDTLDRLTDPAQRPSPPPVEIVPPLALDQAILDDVRALLGPARLHDLLALFARELDARPRAIREAIADQELQRAGAEVHSLKGAASNLGANLVADAACDLELALTAAASGNRTALAPAQRQLAAAVAETQGALAEAPGCGPSLRVV